MCKSLQNQVLTSTDVKDIIFFKYIKYIIVRTQSVSQSVKTAPSIKKTMKNLGNAEPTAHVRISSSVKWDDEKTLAIPSPPQTSRNSPLSRKPLPSLSHLIFVLISTNIPLLFQLNLFLVHHVVNWARPQHLLELIPFTAHLKV